MNDTALNAFYDELEKLSGAKRYLRLLKKFQKSGKVDEGYNYGGPSRPGPLGKALDRAELKYERRISGPVVDKGDKFLAAIPPGGGPLSEIRRRPREVASMFGSTFKAIPRTLRYHRRVGSPGGILPGMSGDIARAAIKAGPKSVKTRANLVPFGRSLAHIRDLVLRKRFIKLPGEDKAFAASMLTKKKGR